MLTRCSFLRRMLFGPLTAVLVITSGVAGGEDGNVMTVFAETAHTSDPAGGAAEEIGTTTEADVQIELTDPIQEGQQTGRQAAETEESARQETRPAEIPPEEDIAQGPGVVKTTEAEETEESAAQEAAGISLSEQDYRVLLRIVEAEAGVCDTKGKILVANVIMNRIRDSEFPNTVTGVVYQNSQFSPVQNGTIDTCQVTQDTVDAVERALHGEDYSQGALYFMNRRSASPGAVRWFDGNLTYLFYYQGHEFYR